MNQEKIKNLLNEFCDFALDSMKDGMADEFKNELAFVSMAFDAWKDCVRDGLDTEANHVFWKNVLNENTNERFIENYCIEMLRVYNAEATEEIEVDFMCGSWFINRAHDLTLYCTPFYDGAKGIAIQVVDEVSEDVMNQIIPFKLTGEIREDAMRYKKIIDQVLHIIFRVRAEIIGIERGKQELRELAVIYHAHEEVAV